MLDIKLLRENKDKVKASEEKRGKDPLAVDEVLNMDIKWKKELKKVEELKHKRNVVSQEINQEKKAGKSAAAKIKEMRGVVDNIKKGEEKANGLLNQRDGKLGELGNIMHPKVPKGKDDSENVVEKVYGKPKKKKFG